MNDKTRIEVGRMRAGFKRMIWFLGIWMIMILQEIATYLYFGYGYETSLIGKIIMIALWLLPLLFFRDDPYRSDD